MRSVSVAPARSTSFPGAAPRRFDSKLEQRFARDFAKATDDWDIVREPAPIPADGTLIFPDFALVHRRDPRRHAWLEIVGFWTPGYLAQNFRGSGVPVSTG